ncbi:MAG TPA: YtxH domain-containing protein [Terriglobales bacterium]|nr:YtxH domain-containing protein [Terriglobales bacterium]
MSDKNVRNAGWFAAGLGLGAVAAILFAPKSGAALRSDILAGVDQGRDFLATRSRDARSTVKGWIDTGRVAADEKKKQLDLAVERGKAVVGRQKDQINATVDAGREGIHQATQKKS